MAAAQAIAAQQGLNAAVAGQQASERGLQGAENLLGTPEQVAGTLGGDENLLRYSQQWTFDPTALNAAGGGQFDNSYLGDIANQANLKMGEARAAYEAGDTAKAEELYQQAVNMPYNHPGRVTNQFAGLYNQSFSLTQSGEAYEDALARELVSGPMAQQVGGLLAESRELLDPNSETYKRYQDELKKGASDALTTGRSNTLTEIDKAKDEAFGVFDLARERELRRTTIEADAARREVRDFGLSRGAARSATGAMAIEGRFADQTARHFADIESKVAEAKGTVASEAGTQKAQAEMFFAEQQSKMHQETGQFFTQFRAEFTQNAPLMAQAFLQNSGGIRDSYMNRLMTTQLAIADMGKFISESYMTSAQMQTQERLGRMQQQAQMMDSLISLGGSLFEAGAFLGGAAIG
jgi:hypothetical protein